MIEIIQLDKFKHVRTIVIQIVMIKIIQLWMNLANAVAIIFIEKDVLIYHPKSDEVHIMPLKLDGPFSSQNG